MDNDRMMDNGLRIVQGNTFATAIEIHAVDATGQPIVDWSLQDSTDIRVWYVFAGREQDITTWQISDGKLVIVWLANMQRVGTYDIFCAGKYNGADWRNAMQYQFSIVRFNHEANIPANVVILDGIYQLSAELQIITQFQGGGGGGTPSSTLPLMDGEAQVGTETAYARGDHRHPSDTSKQDVISDIGTIRSGAAAGATAVQPAALSGYQPLIDSAHKLDYSLLDNTPTIPAAQVNANWNETSTSSKAYIQNKPTIPTESTVSGWGFTKNAGTVTGITMNNTAKTVDANGVVDLGTVITEHQNITGKQDVLVSGQNIKTINGSSVLGSGNLSTLMPVTNHGTSDTTFAVTPNICHIWGEVSSLTLTLAAATDATVTNLWVIVFTSGATPTNLSLPASLIWPKKDPFTSPEANTTYEISIRDGVYATWQCWEVTT